MAALDYSSIISREVHELARRKNFASKNPGVILVFAIVGTLAILLICLFLWKKIQARRAMKATV